MGALAEEIGVLKLANVLTLEIAGQFAKKEARLGQGNGGTRQTWCSHRDFLQSYPGIVPRM